MNIKSSVNTTGTTFKGTPDCPALPSIATSGSPDNQRWPMDPQIENIAVSFGTNLDDPSDDVIYGIFNTMMTKSGGSGSGILSATVPASATSLSWSEASGFSLPTNRPRIRGIYIAQSFPATSAPNLLFFDNTCYTGGVTTGAAFGFCVSIFSSGDTNQQQDVRELPLQVEGISQ